MYLYLRLHPIKPYQSRSWDVSTSLETQYNDLCPSWCDGISLLDIDVQRTGGMSLGTGLFLLLSLVTLVPVHSVGHGLDPECLHGFGRSRALLEVFQVNRPPLTPQELASSTSCTIALMSHVFGNSAGVPFQGGLPRQKHL